jgi:hypothetical protein
MRLTGSQQRQLYEALLSAFPTLPDLDRLTSLVLGENLYAIAGLMPISSLLQFGNK